MKHNYLKTVLILSMVICTFTAIPQKASALPAADTNINESCTDSPISLETELTSSSSNIGTKTGNINSSASNASAIHQSDSTSSDSSSSNINPSVSKSNNVTVNNQNTFNNKSMNKDEAQHILMNADGDYINKVLNNKKNAALNYDRQANVMNIKQFYNIIDEPCYIFSLNYDNNDSFIIADSVYYVGMNSRKVYVINGDSAEFYAYEVSFNRKVNSFISKITDASKQWHE